MGKNFNENRFFKVRAFFDAKIESGKIPEHFIPISFDVLRDGRTYHIPILDADSMSVVFGKGHSFHLSGFIEYESRIEFKEDKIRPQFLLLDDEGKRIRYKCICFRLSEQQSIRERSV